MPDAFSFTAMSNVALNQNIISNIVQITGTNVPSPLSCVNCLCSINGGAYVSSGTVPVGGTVRAQLTASTQFNTQTIGSVIVGGVSGQFAVTTLVQDVVPDQFTFIDQPFAAKNTLVTSQPITVAGINDATTATCVGGTISVNGGPFATSGTVVNGSTIVAQTTSAASWSTTVDVVVSINGVSDMFSVTTVAQTFYLNLVGNIDGTGSGNGTISGDTLHKNAGTGSAQACATGIGIPQDGNWWYFEGSGSPATLCYLAAAMYYPGGNYLSYVGQYRQDGVRGIAIRYYNNSWYCCLVYVAGTISTFIGLGTSAYTACFPALVISGVAVTDYTLLPHASQHQFAPNIAAAHADVIYQAPCYPLLPD